MKTRNYLVLIFLLALGACSSLEINPLKENKSGECSIEIMERIYFGMNSPIGTITEAQWQTFLEKTITPHFPLGLTVLQANGQWLGENSKLVREPSRVVEIVHEDSPENALSISDIVDKYKAAFKQEAVLVVREPVQACVE